MKDPHGAFDDYGYIRLFVSTGIGQDTWATYYRNPKTGSLIRLKSTSLPIRRSKEEAEADLREYQQHRGRLAIEKRYASGKL